MSRSNHLGRYQFCVELGLSPDQTALSQHRQLGSLAASLLKVFDHYEIPATWAVTNVTCGFVRDLLWPLSKHHELALLADSTWLYDAASRADLAATLRQRRQDAAELGVLLGSVIAKDVDLGGDGQTIAGAGFRLLRTNAPFRGQLNFSQRPPAVVARGGVLQLSPSAIFPGCGRFLAVRDAAFAGKNTLLRAIKMGSTEHLTIDAAAMLQRPETLVATLSKIARHAARLRNAGRLHLETTRQALDRWCPSNRSQPARSILRPAA